MKNILLLLILAFGLHTANAQYITIPDSNFRKALKVLYPICFNASDMMDTTCNKVLNATDIDVNSKYIVNIDGIRFFKNLQSLSCYTNQITTIPELPYRLKTLICSKNQISRLPNLPSGLTNLVCSNNLINSLPDLPNSLIQLACTNNEISVLPSLPSTLEILHVYYNKITTLPSLPLGLTVFICDFNKLTMLPDLPNSLNHLSCNGNQITIIPSLPSTLSNFYCGGNQITTLPSLPSSLKYLWCGDNQLMILPSLPLKLENLDCSSNQLHILPTLPDSMKVLSCYNNQLIMLPSLPVSLENLRCFNNQLTALPSLPSRLENLRCFNNQLTTLPSLPSALKYLYCEYNQLTTLPNLPSSLIFLFCDYNQLTALPSFPSSLKQVSSTYNPINCLPPLSFNMSKLYTRKTNIICLPNSINPSALKDTILPICLSTLDICEVNPFVQGKIYNDINNNGIYNTGEQLISQQIVKVLPNNWIGGSDANGNYLVKLDTAINNTWSAINNFRYVTITPASYSLANIHDLGLQSGSYDFGIHFIPNVKDLETTLGSSPARPGFTTNVSVTANNVGTVNQSNITIKLKKPNGFTVLATSIVPTSTSNDTLIWNNISINYLEHQSINIQLQVPANAALGDAAVYEAWSNGIQGDTTPIDNYARWKETIRGSFDPNDKLVNKATLPPTYNANKDRLLYTIRFQNTGTDTAFTVIVRDIIPNNLDITSLRVLNSSHKYQLIVREKNIVEVAFPNIQLPDSNANEAKSHGFVQLEFKPKAGLPLNAEINNSASIFFDYNAPIITNTATTKVQIVTGIASNRKLAFKLFPNPTSSTITVELPYTGNGKYYLTDISGKVIQQNSIENNVNSFSIDVNDVANGTYLLSLEINGNVSTSKVVIVR